MSASSWPSPGMAICPRPHAHCPAAAAERVQGEARRLPSFKPGKAVPQPELIEGVRELILAFLQVRPAFVVDGNEGGAGKSVGRLQSVLAAHGHAEAASRLSRSGVEHHELGREAARDLRSALVPKRVAGDVDEIPGPLVAKRKPNHVARDRLNADGAMARRGSGDKQPLAIPTPEKAGLE